MGSSLSPAVPSPAELCHSIRESSSRWVPRALSVFPGSRVPVVQPLVPLLLSQSRRAQSCPWAAINPSASLPELTASLQGGLRPHGVTPRRPFRSGRQLLRPWLLPWRRPACPRSQRGAVSPHGRLWGPAATRCWAPAVTIVSSERLWHSERPCGTQGRALRFAGALWIWRLFCHGVR